jgi:hypothetical protein
MPIQGRWDSGSTCGVNKSTDLDSRKEETVAPLGIAMTKYPILLSRAKNSRTIPAARHARQAGTMKKKGI